ncbi:MAG: flagellin [Candidatus Rokubacteria bacterium]|nr:flagellin [Candidatus Rokubacteria bacterium]
MPATGDLTRIRTNLAALNALEALRQINSRLGVAQLRLSTGRRINSAADDPSGLTLSNKLDVQARRMGQAISNIGDAENVLNIAEGGLQNLQSLLNEMSEKVLQAANDTQGTNERASIFQQLQQLGEEVDSVARQTQFNNVVLLTNQTMTFQSGPDGADITVFRISSAFTSAALSVNNLTVASQTLASTSLGSVTAALNSVSTVLQQLGASLQRMRIKADNLSIGKLNVIAAQSRIMDADLAAEQLESSKLQILQQTATAMLAAANNGPASILALFQ